MPTEPAPWDRTDCFREKRYEKPDAREKRDLIIEEAGTLRHSQSAVSEISSNRSCQAPWPYVLYREGRQTLLFEDTAHGFTRSQSNHFLGQEKMYEDDNSGFRLEGRYNKSTREHMGASLGPRYQHRGRRLQNWDNGDASLFSTGRHDIPSGKLVDQTSLYLSHPHSDSENSWDQVQSKEYYGKIGVEHSTTKFKLNAHKRTSEIDFGRFTEKDSETRLDRYGSTSSNDSLIGVGPNHFRDHLMSSIDWRPLKWVRSGNSSPWSSLCGQAGSLKESRADLHTSFDILGKTSPHRSPSRLTSDGICFVPDEESHPRKKQRLGWGQGLAKYEKQKVEGAEDDTNKISLIECSISASPKAEEAGHALGENLEARSPKAAASSGCGSPATPYSVTYLSSSDEHASSSGAGFNEVGPYEKDSVKLPDAVSHRDQFPHGSPLTHTSSRDIGSRSIVAESSLEFEHLDVNPSTPSNSLTIDNWQTEDTSVGISGCKRSSAIGKLLSLKNAILQKLERTEYDIDMYEKELRSLNSKIGAEDSHSLGTNYLYADKDRLLEACTEVGQKGFGDGCLKALDRGVQVSSTMHPLNNGFVIPSLVSDAAGLCPSSLPLEKQSVDCQVVKLEANTPVMQDVGSQQSQELALEKQFVQCHGVQTEEITADMQSARCQSLEDLKPDDVKNVSVEEDVETLETQPNLATEQKPGACIDFNSGVAVQSDCMMESPDPAYSILIANKKLAKESSELFVELLPRAIGFLSPDVQDFAVWKHNGMVHERYRKQIEEKIVDRRHFLNFKERVLAIKFRALRHLWKDDQVLPSTRKYRARAQKRYESNCRLNGGHQKYRSTIRSQFASSAGKLMLVPTQEAVRLASKLLSDGWVRPYRSVLKMPAMALDDKEKNISRFISRNGLVEDPIAFEKERAMINPWTSEEREIFIEKFSIFGKNFTQIASFIEHKTTADCVEFYYKNQKSEDLEKIKRRHQLQKQRDCYRAGTYLATSGNNRHRESGAASLDVLGAASVVAACANDQGTSIRGSLQKYAGRPTLGMCFDPGRFRSEGFMSSDKRIFDGHILDSERECTAAAGVLAGIFGSFSSEVMSSCITNIVDPSEGLAEKSFSRPCHKKSAVMDQPFTSEVMQNIEVQYSSEESCEEVNVDWTDDEKGLFVTAVTMFGKDFHNISRYVHSRTEDQCKTFFSKARKRLGLDKLIQMKSIVPVEKRPGSDNDDSCLMETCTRLHGMNSSAKMAETAKSDVLNAAEQNGRAEVVMDEVCNGYVRNDEDLTSLNEQIEVSRSVEASQNVVEVVLGEPSASPESQLSLRGGGLQVSALAEVCQNENESKVLGSVLASVSCSNAHTEGPTGAESYDTARSFDGNANEGNEQKPCKPLSHSYVSKLSMDDTESLDTFQNDENIKKTLINSKSELKENVQDVGSLMETASSKEVKWLPASMEKEKCPVASVTSDCCKSVGSESLPTLVPHQKSSYRCSSSKSAIADSDNMLKAASNGRAMTLYVSDDVMGSGKYFTGSEFIYLGSDHFGKNFGVMSPTIRNGENMAGTHELSVRDSILEGNGRPSVSEKVGWKMYPDGKALGASSVHGREKIPVGTAVSQFQQNVSNVFSQISQQKVHYMQPEVVLWPQKQKESSVVLQKDQSMFKQTSMSSALIRNQQLENTMVVHYPKQNGSHHQFQQEGWPGRMPRPIQRQGSSDSDQSSQHFGGHQLQVLNQRENHRHINTDTHQKEMLQQGASDSEQSSRLVGGYPLQVFNEEEVCMLAGVDTYQQATLQQLAQESYNSRVKSLQQCQAAQQNPQQQVLTKLHTANKQHQNLVTQFVSKPISEQGIELSNQRNQSLQFPEQYQLLHQWQQKHCVQSSICKNHMFLQRTEWQEEQKEHLKHHHSDIKFNPTAKSVYSCQGQVSHIQPQSVETEVKPCPEAEAQALKTGDVKLFGQILLSHPSNLVNSSSSNQVRLEAATSTTSMQGRRKIFNGHENVDWSFAAMTSLEQQSGTTRPDLHSECVEVSAKESESCSVQKAIAQVTERLVSEARNTKHNFAKIAAAYSSQELAGRKLGCWGVKGGHDLCNNSMAVQTVASPLSRDLKYLQGNPMHDSLPDMGHMDQPATTGHCKEMAKDSNMIQGGQSRAIHDCCLSGSREPESDSLFSFDLQQQEFFVELQKRGALDMASSCESVRIGSTYGRHGTVQPPMHSFQSQIKSASGHTGFQIGGVLSGGIVSDPVTAIRTQCPAGEHMTVALEHPQVTSIRGPEPGRGDYSR